MVNSVLMSGSLFISTPRFLYNPLATPAAAQSLVATGLSTNLDIAYYTKIPPVQTKRD